MTKREVKAIAKELLDEGKNYQRRGGNESCWIVGKLFEHCGNKLMALVNEKRRGKGKEVANA